MRPHQVSTTAVPRKTRLIASVIVLLGLATLASPAHAYWLKVRRKGPGAIVEAARAALVSERQWWRYELDVLEEDPRAGLAIEVSRRRLKGGGSDVGVRVLDKKGKLLGALAVVGGKLTVWARGRKAATTGKALFKPDPTLGVPLILWGAFELMPAYRVRLEGEFQGTALLRMTPDYTSTRGLEPMKLGVSKRNLLPTVVEVVDLKGRPTARLLWMKPQKRGGRMLATTLRLRTMRTKKPVDFTLTKHVAGPKAPTRFGKKALASR